MSAARSPLRGRYLVQNPLGRAWLLLHDSVVGLVSNRSARPVAIPGSPKRILLCVGGHLGDAVIATAALTRLHDVFGEAAIGVLSGSWNAKIFAAHPLVRWFHVFDHWKANRSPQPFIARWARHRQTRINAIREMHAVGYDVGLDLYPHYPNFARILVGAHIPVRIGFVSGGAGPLYTHGRSWTSGNVAEDHRAILEVLAPQLGKPVPPRFDLGPIAASASSAFQAIMDSHDLRPRRYAVLHMGSGVAHRQWPLANWITVARALTDRGMGIVLSGTGPLEGTRAAELRQAVPEAIDLVDRLPLPELRCAIRNAAVTLTVNTAAMHVAAAEGAPCIPVVSGVDDPGRWTFALPATDVLTHAVPCAPCYRTRGCDTMLCVRGVQPQSMLRAIAPYLPT